MDISSLHQALRLPSICIYIYMCYLPTVTRVTDSSSRSLTTHHDRILQGSFHFWGEASLWRNHPHRSCYGFLPITLDHGKMTHMFFPTKTRSVSSILKKKTCFPRLGNPIVPRGLVAKHREVHKKLATTISATEIHKSTNHGSFQLRSLQPQVFFLRISTCFPIVTECLKQISTFFMYIIKYIFMFQLIKFTFPSSSLNSQLPTEFQELF